MSAGKNRHVSHYHRHMSVSYPTSFIQRLYTILFAPFLAVLAMIVVAHYLSLALPPINITPTELFSALGDTLARLGVAYIISVVVAIPLAVFVTSSPFLESISLPFFDILQSVPILAFFPIIILVFVRFNNLNGAAVLILFLTMLWNLVFTLVGGINIIPKDISDAAHVFGIKKLSYFFKILLPSLMPQLITGSVLAVAQGWNIIIVAEVLHVYIPHGTSAQDLFGIGSILVNAASSGQTNLFIIAVAMMVLAIAFINFFAWQKLLHYAQRFRFE